MKKYFIILLLFVINVSAQNPKFPKQKISVPCTPEFSDHYKGKWLTHQNKLSDISDKSFATEALKRLNQLNECVTKIYPDPVGADVAWNGSFIKTSFADQVKFVMNQNEILNEEHVKINPVYRYQYNLVLFPWSCCGDNQICNIYPEISGGTGISIAANYLSIATGAVLKEDAMTIDGRTIKFKMPVIGKWNGYDMMTAEGGANAQLFNTHYVLICRKGQLPYIPVTRKEYLDRVIPYVTKTYDQWIANTDQMPDKSTAEEYKKGFVNDKKKVLQRYQDAMDESAKKGLMDSPAIVLSSPMTELLGPVFSTEVEGGRMLITDNPKYFRKDLPQYVPQFFILEWSGNGTQKKGGNWSYNFRKAIEENFPIEKLQAMIDK